MRANQIINLLRDDIEKVNKRASNIGFKSVSNHDVVSCFRALLNRDPESAEVVEHHRQIGTLQGVIERITASEEYRHIIAQKCARVETSPKTPSLMP
jgi:hypothetical protein